MRNKSNVPERACKPVTCKKDCGYYSKFTSTCDYRIMRNAPRGCPVTACTKYVKRTNKRTVANKEAGYEIPDLQQMQEDLECFFRSPKRTEVPMPAL